MESMLLSLSMEGGFWQGSYLTDPADIPVILGVGKRVPYILAW